MIIILNNLVPVFALMGLGHLLGRTGFIGDVFFKASDRLVYYIFFPVMLFWKIGGAGPEVSLDLPLNLSTLGGCPGMPSGRSGLCQANQNGCL